MQAGQQKIDVVINNLEKKLRIYKQGLAQITPGAASLFDPAQIKKAQLQKIKLIEDAIKRYKEVPSNQFLDRMVNEVEELFLKIKKYKQYFKKKSK